MAFTTLRDRDSASIFIEKGLQLNPKNINLNKLKINDLFIHKKYKEAIVLLKHIDSLEPNEHYTQKMLGKSYFNVEDYQTAKTYFEKAKKIDRNDFKAYTYLGRIYKKLDNLEKTKFHFTLATFIGKEPRDDEYFELALLAYDAKKPKIALKNFKKTTEENSKNRDALFWLAKLSDDYYKDKKIGYELYKKYSNRFEGKDSIHDEYVKSRLSTIKKEYFLKGVMLE